MSGPAVISARDYGVVGNGVADDWAALTEALAAAAPGRVLQVPPGKYRLSQPLVLRQPVVLQGSGGAGDTPATKLVADSGVTAIIVSREAPGGDWCSVRDLALRGSGEAGHGVLLRARASLSGLNISGFGGHGVLVDSTAQGDNANSWSLTTSRVVGCGGSGVRAVGGDSNSGVVIGVDVTGCSGWGFDDDSFLGNTLVACHAAANSLGAYRSGQAASNTCLVGCYSESDQPPSMLHPKCVVIGGTHGAAISGAGGQPVTIHGGANAPLKFLSALTGLVAQVGSGTGDTSGGILSMLDPLGGRAYLKYMGSAPPAYGVGTRIYGWNAENDGTSWAFAISGKGSIFAVQPEGVGRAVDPAWFNFPRGYMQQGHKVVMGNAAPTSGDWIRGDRVENSAPVAGGFMGWVCVESGAPGVWKPYGPVEI